MTSSTVKSVAQRADERNRVHDLAELTCLSIPLKRNRPARLQADRPELFGRHRRSLNRLFLLLLIPLGFFWPGWLFWGGLMCVIGFRHPPVLREDTSLGARQRVIGILTAAVLALTFIPAPFIF